MNLAKTNAFASQHTWKDTAGCAAVLLAMLLGTLSGAYVAYTESGQVAVAVTATLTA